MKNVIMILAVVAAPAMADQLCTPNYQVEHDKCRATGEVTGYVEREAHNKVINGACDVKANRQDCNDPTTKKQETANALGVSIDALVTVDQKLPGIAGMCGDPLRGNLRQKVDIVCYWTAQVPQYKKEEAAYCSIVSAKDLNNCYSAETVAIDESAIAACLKMRPTTDEEYWIKSQCLIDANQAVNDYKLNFSNPNTVSFIQGQLRTLRGQVAGQESLANLSRILTEKVK